MFSWKCFEIAAPKTWKFFRKTYVGEFPFDKFVRPQSTVHRTRNSTTDTFLKVLRKERVFKNFENFKKIFVQNYSFFFSVASLQFWISAFNKITLKEKCFLWLFSEIVSNLPEKRPLIKPFYLSNSNVESRRFWKKSFHKFSRGCSEKLLFWKF